MKESTSSTLILASRDVRGNSSSNCSDNKSISSRDMKADSSGGPQFVTMTLSAVKSAMFFIHKQKRNPGQRVPN